MNITNIGLRILIAGIITISSVLPEMDQAEPTTGGHGECFAVNLWGSRKPSCHPRSGLCERAIGRFTF